MAFLGIRRQAWAAWLIVGMWVVPAAGLAAETADPVPMTKTLITLTVDATEPLKIHSTFQERPPTITLNFSGQRIVGSLPERSTVAKGIIQAITARYEHPAASGTASKRFLRSLQIVLAAPYSFRVRSEVGRVVVEIDHPASIGSTDVEVGLVGGTLVSGLGRSEVSERFRAMQEAMARAAASPCAFQISGTQDAAAVAAPVRVSAPTAAASRGPVSPPRQAVPSHLSSPPRSKAWPAT